MRLCRLARVLIHPSSPNVIKKLILSSFNFSSPNARQLLTSAFSTKSTLLYSIDICRLILRCSGPFDWILKLLSQSLDSQSQAVVSRTVSVILEASETKEILKELCKLPLRELLQGRGGFEEDCLLARFEVASEQNDKELEEMVQKWEKHNNLIYVDAVEKKFMQALIFDPASAHKHSDVSLPVHLYEELAKNQRGLKRIFTNYSFTSPTRHHNDQLINQSTTQQPPVKLIHKHVECVEQFQLNSQSSVNNSSNVEKDEKNCINNKKCTIDDDDVNNDDDEDEDDVDENNTNNNNNNKENNNTKQFKNDNIFKNEDTQMNKPQLFLVARTVKSSLWILGHVGSTEEGMKRLLCQYPAILECLCNIACTSPILSLRGTAFFVLCMMSGTEGGRQELQRLGWKAMEYISLVGQNIDFLWNSSFLEQHKDFLKNSRGKSALTKSYRHGTVDDINLSKSQRKPAFTSPSQSTQITNRQQTNTFKDTINSQTTKRQSSNALSKLLSAADLHRRPSFLKKATYFKYKPSFLKTFIKEMKPSFKRDASSEVILQSSSLPSTLSQNVKTKKTTTQENIKDLQPTTKTPKHSLRRTKQPMPQATSQTTSSTLSTASSPSVTSSSASTYVPSASLDGSQAPFYYSLTSLQKSAKKDRSFKTLSLAHRLSNQDVNEGLHSRFNHIKSSLRSKIFKRELLSGESLHPYRQHSNPFVTVLTMPRCISRHVCFPPELFLLFQRFNPNEATLSFGRPFTNADNKSQYIALFEMPYKHKHQHCTCCCQHHSSEDDSARSDNSKDKKDEEEVKREVMRLVTHLASSVPAKSCQLALKNTKLKHPETFRRACLYSDVSLVLASHSFSSEARIFVQGLFEMEKFAFSQF